MVEVDEDLNVAHQEDEILVYNVTMDMFSLVAESFTQLFIQTSRLEMWNLKDGFCNTQEVVLWDVSGQLFSFHRFILNNSHD